MVFNLKSGYYGVGTTETSPEMIQGVIKIQSLPVMVSKLVNGCKPLNEYVAEVGPDGHWHKLTLPRRTGSREYYWYGSNKYFTLPSEAEGLLNNAD